MDREFNYSDQAESNIASAYAVGDQIPDPPREDVIDPTEVPCETESGIHDPVVVDVIPGLDDGKIPVVKCRQCGVLCDQEVLWSEYDQVEVVDGE